MDRVDRVVHVESTSCRHLRYNDHLNIKPLSLIITSSTRVPRRRASFASPFSLPLTSPNQPRTTTLGYPDQYPMAVFSFSFLSRFSDRWTTVVALCSMMMITKRLCSDCYNNILTLYYLLPHLVGCSTQASGIVNYGRTYSTDLFYLSAIFAELPLTTTIK